MKKSLRFGFAVLILAMGVAVEGVVQEQEGKAVAIVTVGPVDQAVIDRAVEFCRYNTALKVSPVRAVECPMNTMEEIGACVTEHLGDDDVCLIALVWLEEEPESQGLHLLDQRVVVVNMRSFKTEDVSDEVFGRRAERQVMQNLGLLLGLDPCPNPQCVLWSYSTMDELDAKGRNFCPPCLERLQKKAVEKGMTLNPDSPFNFQ